jgi:hypothetical protein
MPEKASVVGKQKSAHFNIINLRPHAAPTEIATAAM